MDQRLHNQIISEYEALVEPYQARGRSDVARRGLASIISRYGIQAVEEALESLVMHYELKSL